MIEIMPIGGYNEFGKNMTAIKVDNSVFIFDMGFHVEKYIRLNGDDDVIKFGRKRLIEEEVIPDDSVISSWRKNVKGIFVSHAHLDHIGAIPYLAKRYKAPIFCTAYTAEVIKTLAKDDGHKIWNKIVVLGSNESYHFSKELSVEFIHTTHSIPHTVMIALHTKYGVILYANDFKFDNYPTLGKKPNYKKLRRLSKKGVLALIVDGTGAKNSIKTPSESVAKEMIKDLLYSSAEDYRNIIITTFSSHIARLKSIIYFAKKIGRKPVMLGRSMYKYVSAAEKINLVDFRDVKRIKFKSQIRKFLKSIMLKKEWKKYLIICTGHQGEEEAVLGRMAYGKIKFDLNSEDCVIFSCRVIPSPTNIEQRRKLESQLAKYKVHIFKDVHVSGHASKEDHRLLLELVKPKHIIPAHGDKEMIISLVDFAKSLGYENVHTCSNGKLLRIS